MVTALRTKFILQLSKRESCHHYNKIFLLLFCIQEINAAIYIQNEILLFLSLVKFKYPENHHFKFCEISFGQSPSMKCWQKLHIATSSMNKMMKHVVTKKIVGHDLKFADNSLDNRLQLALQFEVYKSTWRSVSAIDNNSFKEPLHRKVNGLPCMVEE